MVYGGPTPRDAEYGVYGGISGGPGAGAARGF